MKFVAKLYVGEEVYIGKVCANTFRSLKRVASSKCNNYYYAIDAMIVCRANDTDLESEVKFTRMNHLSPNNTVVRGCWQ